MFERRGLLGHAGFIKTVYGTAAVTAVEEKEGARLAVGHVSGTQLSIYNLVVMLPL